MAARFKSRRVSENGWLVDEVNARMFDIFKNAVRAVGQAGMTVVVTAYAQ